MKRHLLFLIFTLFISSNIFGQGCPVETNDCGSAISACYPVSSRLAPGPGAPVAFPGCPANVLDNPVWYQFEVLTAGVIDVSITQGNCANNSGMQSGLYTGCLPTDMALSQQCGCTTGTMNHSAFLVPGTYYVLLDGCAGDLCDYTISISGDIGTVPVFVNTPPTATELFVCPFEEITFFIGSYSGGTDVFWNFPSGVVPISAPPYCETVTVIWGDQSGDVSFSVSNGCGNSEESEPITITVLELEGIDFGAYCASDPMAIGWFHPGSGLDIPCTLPGQPFDVTITTDRGCDSVVSIEVECFFSFPEIIIETICEGNQTSCDIYGEFYDSAIDTTIIIENGSTNFYCDSTIQLEVIVVDPAVSFLTPPVLTCENQAAGIQLTADGILTIINAPPIGNTTSTSGINYIFSAGNGGNIVSQNLNDIIIDQPGTYYVTIEADNSFGYCPDAPICVAMDSIVIVGDFDDPEFTVAPTDITCFGANNGVGTINLVPGAGVGPFTYQWSTNANDTLSSVDDLPAGTYTVTVTGSNGCTEEGTVTIAEPTELTLTETGTVDASCGGGMDGAGTISISGGTPNYSIAWPAPGSQTTLTATNLGSGSYTVTVTDDSGCSETIVVTISEPASVVVAEFSSSTSCDGGMDGSAWVTVNSGSPPYIYTWSANAGSSTDSLVNGLAAGSYTITVADQTGCQEIVTVDVDSPDPITATVDEADADCFGTNTGTATITPAGGTPGYSYAWPAALSLGDVNSASSLPAGTYEVTISDANGCTETVDVVIGEPDELMLVEESRSDVDCNGDTDGSATVGVTGGEMPYSYAWSTGGSNRQETGMPPGTHDVTVTDGNNCTAVLQVEILEPTALAITETDNQPADCAGDANGSSTVSVSGGTPGYTYDWGASSSSTTETANDLTQGSHTVVATDANGCTISLTINIDQPNPLQVQRDQVTDPSCFGDTDGTASVTTTGGTTPYTYQWSSSTNTTDSETGLGDGVVTVTVTDGNGCTDEVSITLTQPDEIVLNIDDQSDATCFGFGNGSATISATGGSVPITYLWSDPGATVGPTNTTLRAGNYTVTATDGNGCTEEIMVMIDEPDSIQYTIDFINDVTCNGANDGAAQISVSGGNPPFVINWAQTVTGASASGPSVTGLEPGEWRIDIRDNQGCATFLLIDIDEPTPIVPAETDNQDVVCYGEDNGSSTVTASGGVGPYSYAWTYNTQSGPTANLPAGAHTVTVTDANGCTEELTINIAEPPVLSVAITGQTDALCNGAADGTADAAGAGGVAPYTYAWDGGATGPNGTGFSQGPVGVTVTDANGCTAETQVTIGEPEPVSATVAPDDADCFGVADGGVVVTPAGGTAPYDYTIGTNTTSNPTITGLAAGNYTVTVTDANGCTFDIDFTVGEPDEVTATADATDALCFGGTDGTATVTPSGGVSPFTYVWTDGQTTQTATGLPMGSIDVTVTDAQGCTGVTSVTVDEPTEIMLAMAQDPVSCTGGDDGAASVVTSGGTPPYTYEWDNSQVADNADNLPAGLVGVTVTDNQGCTQEASIMVQEPAEAVGVDLVEIIAAVCGEANGSVDITPTGGTPPYNFLWTPGGQTTEDAANLLPGNVTVVITDANGCTVEETYNVSEPDALQILSETPVNISCNAGSDGSIAVVATGGNAPYGYSWGPGGQTTPTIDGLTAGTYDLTITDADGCTVTTSLTLTEPDALATAITPTIASCGLSDGTLDLTVTGGTAPYSYAWDNSDSDEDPQGVPADTYCVTVTDANGCTIEDCADVVNPNSPSLMEASTDVNCFGGNDGTVEITITGGTAPFSYSWDGPMVVSPAPNHNDLIAGTYEVTVTDVDNCSAVISVTIDEPATALGITTDNVDLATCGAANGNIEITATGGTTPYTYLWSGGPDLDAEDNLGLTPGSYDLTVTDANGCTAVENFDVSEPDALRINDRIVIDVLCFGENNGSITLDITGGRDPYTFAWGDGSTDQNRTDLTADDYEVTVSDADGCTVAANITVTEPDLLTATPTGSLASCGLADGSISMVVEGGTSPYTYVWTNGADPVKDPTDLMAGTYDIIVTDNNGCTVAASAEVVNPNAPVMTFSSTNVLCFGESSGTITLNVTSGTPPYTFDWGASVDPNNVPAGIYTVTVTDAGNCSDVIDMIEITEPDALALTTDDIVEATCGLPNGSVEISIAGGTTPYTYDWNGAGDNPNGPLVNDLTPGTYSVIVTDGNGCTITDQFDVIEPDALQAAGVITNVSCFEGTDGAIAVTTTGGDAPYTYIWSNGNPNESISDVVAGTYILTVTDDNGCTFILSQEITEPTAIEASSTNQFATCNSANGSIDLTVMGGTGPYTFVWDGGNGSINPVEDPTGLTNGSYIVTITDANGCELIYQETLIDPSGLAVESSVKDVECFGESNGGISVTVTNGPAPYSFLWSSGSTDDSIENVPAGTYNVTVTDGNGCTFLVTELVTEPDPLVAVADFPFSSPTCNGFADAAININVVGGTSPYSYEWDNGAANVEDPSGLAAGTYNVTVTDANGCFTIEEVVIDEPDAIEIEFVVVDATCAGLDNGTIDVTVVGGTIANSGDYTYEWSGGLAGLQDQSGVLAGLYSLIVTDDNGCEETVTIEVEEPAVVEISVTEESDNGGYNVSCSDSDDGFIRVNTIGGFAPYTYSWSNGGSAALVENLAAGDYEVTVLDANGCEAILPVNLTAPDPLTFEPFSLDPTCFEEGNGLITFDTIIGGTGPYVYALNGEPFRPIPRFGNLDGGDYEILIQDANGCEFLQAVTLEEPLEVIVDLGADTVIELGGSYNLNPQVLNTSVASISYEWTKGKLNDTTGILNFTQTVSPVTTTTYEIRIEDENGCPATDQVIVQVSKDRPVYIPNVFSPNDDTFNDIFTVYGKEGAVTRILGMKIYDRWGELVYDLNVPFDPIFDNASTNDEAKGWNGRFRGTELNPGVFVYVIPVEFADGSVEVYTGDVTLAR